MEGIVSSLGDKWRITCIYVSAETFVDVAKKNERIDSFFVKVRRACTAPIYLPRSIRSGPGRVG